MIMDAPQGWNDSDDVFISRLVKAGYRSEVIRNQVREYACDWSVMFSDLYLVSCFLSDEIKGSSVKCLIFPNRPSEALFPKNLTGIFHRGGIDQSLINQFPPS